MSAVAAFIWVVCGMGAAGLLFAYFQDNWPILAEEDAEGDFWFALGLGLLGGPCSLFAALISTRLGKYGWRLWQ